MDIYVETYKHIDEIKPWKKLSNHVKENNKSIANSPNQKFHYIKPKKSQIVILDKDGIYKLRDSDYKPEENTHQNSNDLHWITLPFPLQTDSHQNPWYVSRF